MFVHELVSEHARTRPDAAALRHRGTVVTYRQLDSWAEAFCQAVLDRGAGPERMVGVMAPRSPAAVACLLGVLKAGAVYVPIDQDYPEERVRYIVSDVGSAMVCVFHGERGAEYLRGTDAVPLDAVPPAPAGVREGPRRRHPRLTPRNLAYVVYTSGSTGSPKGVMIEHRSLTAVVPELIRRYGIGPDDRVLHMAPLGFDTSLSEIFRALCAGACLCVMPAEGATPTGFLVRLKFLKDERVTKAVLPTALLRMLRRVDLPSLDTLVVTGEAPSKELVDRWAPGRRLLNAYGSTETTFASTVMECLPGQDRRPPAGRPIGTADVFVVDEDGDRLRPDGEVGEICIAGAGVARGYVNRPELTAQRFVPNLWGTTSERAFRTGDLGRILPGGIVECLGRKDSQIKIRGQRVDLVEVESVLRQYDGVRDAVVTAATEPSGGQVLAGHIVPDSTGTWAEDRGKWETGLRRHLGSTLPAAAVPQYLYLRDEFPLNEHGKVDRRLLDQPFPRS